MNKICNSCGREFDETTTMHAHTHSNGTEYFICDECENTGIEITEKSTYYICKNCGFPHAKKDYTGICKFCEHKNDFEKLELTQPEEQLLDENPNKLYTEKLDKDTAKKIADWIESPERKQVGARHKRDRHIDGFFVVGIIIGYLLLDFLIRNFINKKQTFIALLIPTILVIISAPVFKKIDRKPRKKPLPLWIIPVSIAVFAALYWIIMMLLK